MTHQNIVMRGTRVHTNINFTVSFAFIIPVQLLHIVKMELYTNPAASLIADVYRSRSASLRGELTSRSYFTALVAAGTVLEYAATCLKDLRQAPIRKGILLFHLMGFAWPQDCLVLFIIPRLFVADSHSGRMSFGDCRCLWIQ